MQFIGYALLCISSFVLGLSMPAILYRDFRILLSTRLSDGVSYYDLYALVFILCVIIIITPLIEMYLESRNR